MHVVSSVPHKMLQKDINLPIQTLATAYINIESPCDIQAQLLRHELTRFSYFFFLSNDLVYLTALVSCKRLENLTGLIQTLVFLPVLTVGPESRNFIPVNSDSRRPSTEHIICVEVSNPREENGCERAEERTSDASLLCCLFSAFHHLSRKAFKPSIS